MIIPAFQHRPDESLVVANLKEKKVEQYKILGAIALENTKLICQLAAKGGGGRGCWSGAIKILQSLTEKSGRFYRDSTKKNPSSPLPPPLASSLSFPMINNVWSPVLLPVPYFREFGKKSTANPLIDIFRYSCRLSA